MYQALYYVRDKNDPDAYHYFLRDDKKHISKFKYNPTLYKLDQYGEYTTLFGDRCSPITGKYDRNDPTIYEKDISKELVLLRDQYYKSDDKPSFHNLVYLDIEIEIIGALNEYTIKEAKAEITSIALLDVNNKQTICFILDKNKEIESISIENKHIISCIDEKTLIRNFLSKWEEIDPTIVVGWNSDFFDMPYLYYRIKKIMGDEVYRLSPIGKITEDLNNSKSPIKIGLINCLDFMLLFKKYITKEETSYKLGDIGTKYVKLGKIEYNGSLDALFKENKNKFIEYNIRDVEILEALENKLKFIELTVLISHLCHTPYESIYYNTELNEGAILTYLKRKNIIAPNKPTTVNPSIRELEVGDYVVHQRGTPTIEGTVHEIDNKQVIVKTKGGAFITRFLKSVRKKEGYAGGFLLDPQVGLHNWSINADFASLYPSIIRSLNLGIETLKARIVIDNPNYNCWYSLEELREEDPEKIVTLEKLDKRTYTLKSGKIKIKDLIETIIENNWTVSANGVIFSTDKPSIVAELLAEWFNMRKEFKNAMKKAYKDGDKVKGELFHMKQHSFKIALNSIYGAFAINSWRFTDGHKILSSAVTTFGQRAIQETIKHANKIINEEFL
jgi:DNA polymerase elongation subunit (family B)